MASVLHNSPRPVPVLLTDTPFSQRKRTPFRAGRPPKAPAKSCPPVSRVFLTPRDNGGPKLVSFKSERKHDFSSPCYDSRSNKSYFEQCFDILEKMGEGSFGVVYKVRCRDDGKLYAVKKSRQKFRGQWDRRQKLAEVEKHERLPAHSNCVKFYKAWEERDYLYIQTELCEMSLSEYADLHGHLPERRVWSMLIDLLKGLSHLHNNNLCHFDIKPDNIFLSLDGITCKLGDFGLCVSEEQGFKNAMEGDAKYLAPELMNGRFGKPADVFSLGISLLELACELELPSQGTNWHCLREGKLPQEFIQDLSPSLTSILTRMMDPCPEARPTVNQLLQESCIRWAGFRHRVCRIGGQMTYACRMIFNGFLFLVMTLFSLFTFGKLKPKSVSPQSSSSSDELTTLHRVRINSLHNPANDSFSDDEDELLRHITATRLSDDSSDAKSRFNRSWINNSPMRYPSPIYTGPPIPLNFGDSSFECSPERATKASPSRINLNHSYYSPSPNASSRLTRDLSSTPLHKSPTTSSPIDLSRNIEPKNLLSVFDTSD